eukprot:1105108-Amphidinium_carterae.1
MQAVINFAVTLNSFTGMLPACGLREVVRNAPRRRRASYAGRDYLRYQLEQPYGNASREWQPQE